MANPPQCCLVNQLPCGNASQDADRLRGASPWSLTSWVDLISFLCLSFSTGLFFFFSLVYLNYKCSPCLAIWSFVCIQRRGLSLCRPYWCCPNYNNGCTVVRNQNRSNCLKHMYLRSSSCSCISSIARPDRCYCASNDACEEAGF